MTLIKTRLLWFLLLVFTTHAEILYESGDLLEFIGGSASQLAYDNFVSHISEGIADPGYNDYGPDWLDIQTNGFGNYRVINPDGGTLPAWRMIFQALLDGNPTLADAILSDSLDSFNYDLIVFDETRTNRELYMLRERLDLSYLDPNQPTSPFDDVMGSFRNGWGLYLLNPQASRQQLVVEVPHPCDDFIAPYVATELFLQSDALAFLLAGAGREVRWTGSGNYSNNKSLSDPSRNGNSIFQVFHEVLCDSLMETGPHAPLVLHMHSFDDNAAHEGFQDIVLSAGWDAWNANKPIRDITADHLDFVNFTAEYPIAANSFGEHGPVRVDSYYRVHYNGDFQYYGAAGSYPIPHTYTLLGPNTGVQMNYLRQYFHPGSVYEPWVQVEMMEKPQLFQDLEMPLTELYAGSYPTGYRNFSLLMDYFQPFLDAVETYLVNWETVSDTTAPPSVTGLHTTLNGHHYLSLAWDPVEDTNFRTYRVFFDSVAVDETSATWDLGSDAELQDMTVGSTTLLQLDPEADYEFRIQAIDYFGNASSLSDPVSEEIPGHPAATVIENFDSGDINLGSWPFQDLDPQDWSLSTERTFMASPYALKLYGNTWKTEAIDPVHLEENSVWQVSANVQYSGEIQGMGFSDGSNTLFYAFNGSEQLDIDDWVTVDQGYFPTDRWNVYRLPLGQDWFARYEYLPVIDEIVFINDRDTDYSSVVYFDEVLDISSIIEFAPRVEIQYDLNPIALHSDGTRSVDVDFTSQVEDGDSDEHSYLWSFGDGETSTDAHPSHTFWIEDDHSYTVLLEVVDESGFRGQAVTTVEVDAGPSSFPLTLNFVGDIMLARRYEEDGGIIPMLGVDAIFEPTLAILGNAADLTIANLECALTNGGTEHPTKSVTFRGNPANVSGLANAGIDIVTLANNHTLDYGFYGLQQTQQVLSGQGIHSSGSGVDSYAAYQPLFQNINGVSLAFLANSDRTGQYNNAQPYLNAGFNKPGFAYLTPYYLGEQIQEVEDAADLIIMEMHAGSEYSYEPGANYDGGMFGDGIDPQDWIAPRELNLYPDVVEEDENYSPDSDVPHMWDRELRHYAIDAGADLVVVHHPHILQGLEVYNGKLIAHSLGNFVFELNYHETFPTIVLQAEINADGFSRYWVRPVYIDDYIPRPAEGELGLFILDYLARRSRELDTYLRVDRNSGIAEVILDTLNMPRTDIYSRRPAYLRDEDGYRVSQPVPVHDLGDLHVMGSPPDGGGWEYRLGRELLWYGNMEPEGASQWNLNSGDEWLDDTEALRGNWSITQVRISSAGDNIVTNLENRVRLNSDRQYSVHAAMKTQNGSGVTVQVRFYQGRTGGAVLSTQAVNSGIQGTHDWQEDEAVLEVPGDASYFDLRLNTNPPSSGQAQAWFDDVGVLEWSDWSAWVTGQQVMSPNDWYYLQVRSPAAPDTIAAEYVVQVLDELPPVNPDFSLDPEIGLIPLEVQFTDLSTGPASWWSWDFGDGSQSMEQNPRHVYTTPGIYDVALTVRDQDGSLLTHSVAGGVRVFSEYAPGDLNFDGDVTIVDVIQLVNIILGNTTPAPAQIQAGDLNQDGDLTVQDLVSLVQLILYG